MLFNEEMITNSLEAFVETVFKKHAIQNVNSKDVAQMIIEELEALARKKGTTSVGIGMQDEELEKAIIKAPSKLEEWKKSKETKKTTTKTTTKATKKETNKIDFTKTSKKEEKKVVNEQTELIDFSSLIG